MKDVLSRCYCLPYIAFSWLALVTVAEAVTSLMPAAQGASSLVKQSVPTFMTPTIAQISPPATLSSAPAVADQPTLAMPMKTNDVAAAASLRINAKAVFAQWKYLLKGTASFIEIATFIERHPTWPKQTVLREKAENVLVDPTADTASIAHVVAFFDRYQPMTGKGQFYYAKALLAQGKIDQAKQAFYKLLVSFPIPSDMIGQLVNYKQYMPFLWAYLHSSNMLYTKHSSDATALLGYLTPQERERISLRLDLLAKVPGATDRAQKLISTPGNNDGVIFELIRYYRQLKTDEGTEAAVQLFLKHSFLDEEQHAGVFWRERNLLARRMMDAKRPIDAYNLVKNHGFKIKKETYQGERRCDEECAHAHCMTGWLALNYANKPAKALSVFQKIGTVVKESISKARALYWVGASYVKLNQLNEAKKAFLEASTYSTTFYGQMAASQLASETLKKQYPTIQNVAFKAVLEVVVPPEEKEIFENLELVQVIRSVPDAIKGHNCDAFFFALLNISKTLVFQRQVFDLAETMKSRAYAILLARKKHMTFKVAYPLLRDETRKSTVSRIVPKSQFGALLMPLAHAIIRRESGFDESALSSANARGMMQLTPPTAKEEARAIKRFGISIPSKINLYEKIQNILLGTSHIEGLLTAYQGNLVLSLAAYNAGPKPVSEWIRDYGDPRLPETDIVNWIECIPYAETRNYVQRVLENFIVYAQFLHEEETGTSNQIGSLKHLNLLSYLQKM